VRIRGYFSWPKGSAGKEVGETGLDYCLSVWKTIIIVTINTINIIKFNTRIPQFAKNNYQFSTIINKSRPPRYAIKMYGEMKT